jgi:hypothetical protein
MRSPIIAPNVQKINTFFKKFADFFLKLSRKITPKKPPPRQPPLGKPRFSSHSFLSSAIFHHRTGLSAEFPQGKKWKKIKTIMFLLC